MNDQEKIMSALAQGYQLLSKAMKQKPSKEGFQQVLQMLGDDGIQACVQVVDQGPEIIAQTMAEVIQKKQTQKAEKGAKLNRLIALNDSCPEGYLKKGGKCKKCEKGKKINPMEKGVFHVTAYFKDGGIAKMQLGNILNAVSKVKDTIGGIKNTVNTAKNIGSVINTATDAIQQGIQTAQQSTDDWAAQQAKARQANTTAIQDASKAGIKAAKTQEMALNTALNKSMQTPTILQGQQTFQQQLAQQNNTETNPYLKQQKKQTTFAQSGKKLYFKNGGLIK